MSRNPPLILTSTALGVPGPVRAVAVEGAPAAPCAGEGQERGVTMGDPGPGLQSSLATPSL